MATDLYSGLIGALIGSVLGAVGSYWAQRSQTSRLIEAGTEQYRLAADEERKRTRDAADVERAEAQRAMGRTGAVDLLEGLAVFDAALPHLRMAGTVVHNNGSWQARRKEQAEHALAVLRRMEIASLPLLRGLQLAARWDRLRGLASEFVTSEVQTVHEGQMINPSALWTEAMVNRAQLDVEQYAGYVHASLGAWLAGDELPPDLDPPHLGREDPEVWRWQTTDDA